MVVVFYNVVLVVHYNDDDYDDDYQNAIYIHFKDQKGDNRESQIKMTIIDQFGRRPNMKNGGFVVQKNVL